jgi:hypothetical protein
VRGVVVEPREGQLRELGRSRAGVLLVAGGEDHRDRLGVEAARDEDEDVGAGVVEPVGVVDHAQQRSALGRLGEDVESGQRDEEALGALRPALQPERAAEGLRLDGGDRVDAVEHGSQELVQRREGQPLLQLGPATHEDLHAARPRARLVEQGGLADPRRAAHDEDRAVRLAGGAEQVVDVVELLPPAVKRGRAGRLGVGAGRRVLCLHGGSWGAVDRGR